ncbi:VCBS repeat-containing protein [soil metagenome]
MGSAGCRALKLVLLLAPALLVSGCAGAGSGGGAAAVYPAGTGESGFLRDVYAFGVLDEHGTAYTHPFLGGLIVPRPQFVDLDGDGDPDLFLQERSGELMYFENTGTAEDPRFEWRNDRFGDLHVGEWFLFHDLTGDGRLELMSERPYSYIRVYRNEGTPEAPRFEVALDSIRDVDGRPIFSDRQNIPQLVDLDCSGTLDLLLGRIDGMITHYREEERVDGFPRFRKITDRFENIEIVGQIGSMHGANAMAFIDWTGNGALDLLWGDFFEPSVLLIPNRQPCPGYDLDAPPEPLRTPEGNLLTSGHNVPVPVDLDGDGRTDLVVGVLGGAFNPVLTASSNLHHYRRGADGLFRKVTERFLDGIDVGSESIVAVADLTGNGVLDLVVGNKIDPVETRTGRLYLFAGEAGETGEAGASPLPGSETVFRLADTLSLAASFHYAPALGELFGSGRPDLLLGTWNDGIRVYRNTGPAPRGPGGAFPGFEEVPGLTLELTRGSHAVPALGDLTGNGLLDVVVGRSSGQLTLFRNTGTREAPAFERVTDELGGINVGRRSAPYLADVTGNGLLDLLVGREEGGALLFRNVGTREAPEFEAVPDFDLPLFGLGRPVPVDLAGDGQLGVLSGAATGGVIFFRDAGGGWPGGDAAGAGGGR